MQTYKVNKGFIIQKLDDKTVIFDGEKSVLYTFNETASYIFKKIKSGADEKETASALAKRYEVKEERAKKDVRGLISEMKKKKILVALKPTKKCK